MDAYQVGDWAVYPELNQMTQGDKMVTLEPRILTLLNCFSEHPGQVLNRDQLIEKAWDGVIVSESTINHTVGGLRRALGDKARDPLYIQTVAKKGYRLVAVVSKLESRQPLRATQLNKKLGRDRPRHSLYAALALLVFSVGLGIFHMRPPAPQQSYSFSESKPLTSLQGLESNPAIDPAAEWLYFTHTDRNQQFGDIYRQRLAGGNPELVMGATPTVHETSPSISPDGQTLAYARFYAGGCSVVLYDLAANEKREEVASCGPYMPRIDWTPGGDLLFTSASDRRTPSRIKRINIDSGRIDEVTKADYGIGDYSYALSHDGTRIAFLRTTHWNHSDLYVKNLNSGKETLLRQFPTWFFDIAWASDDRSLLYTPEPSQRALEALDTETGKVSQVFYHSKGLFGYRILKGTNQLISTERSWDTNIYSVPLGTGTNALITANQPALVASTRSDWQPRVNRDDQTLAFLSDRTGHQEIWASDTRGLNARQLSHLDGTLQVHVFSWETAGRNITFDGYDDRIYILDTETGHHTALTPASMTSRNPSFSLDGDHIVFASDKSGTWQIWQISASGGPATQVTKHGGFSAQYDADGALYVTKYFKDGLWHVDPKSGGEKLAVANMITGPMQQCTLRDNGVYYLNNQAGRAQVFFHDWQTKQAKMLHDMPHTGFTFELSADGQDILFTRDDSRASDIVLIE